MTMIENEVIWAKKKSLDHIHVLDITAVYIPILSKILH
jgi:hypothetical protein